MADGPEWARLTDQEVVLLARGGREAAYRELDHGGTRDPIAVPEQN